MTACGATTSFVVVEGVDFFRYFGNKLRKVFRRFEAFSGLMNYFWGA
jgi:hypothetical protein